MNRKYYLKKNFFKVILIRFVFIILILLSLGTGLNAGTNLDKLSPQDKVEALILQADTAIRNHDAPLSASIYSQIVDLCKRTSELEHKLPENMYNLGQWSSYCGDHATAIDVLISLLEMIDNTDNEQHRVLKAKTNMELGLTYFFMERWDDALVYYQKARSITMDLNNKQGMSIAENNIGNIYQKKGNYELAIEQYDKCLKLQEEIGDSGTICNTYYNIGTCYYELKDYDEGMTFLEKGLYISTEINDWEIQSLCLTKIAYYSAFQKRRFNDALQQIDKAEKIALNNGYGQVLEEVYLTKSMIDEERGDFVSSLEYYKKYKAQRDTLFNKNSADKLHEFEIRYHTKEKELEIVHQQAEINRHRSNRIIFIISLSLSALVLVLLWWMLRLRNRRNLVLTDMNTTKDKFFSIISHDLKNPAIAQRDALQQLILNSKKWDEELLSQYYNELLKSADGQVELLYNLLNWAQVQTGRMPYNPIRFDLIAALRSDIVLIENMSKRKGVIADLQMPETAIVTGDSYMITTVVRNLFTNAVKYTSSGGTISLDIEPLPSADSGFTITVSDTGTGMSDEQLHKLFVLDKRRSQKGTNGETGSGLGLIVCKELLEKHGSTLCVESKAGKGSRFWFILSDSSQVK